MTFPTLISVGPVPLVTPDCGTAACFAGWRALKDGYNFYGEYDWTGDPILFNPATGHRLTTRAAAAAGNGDPNEVAAYAGKRFELSEAERSRLFDACNKMDALKELVDQLCADPERSDQAKAALRETMDDVLAAFYEGRWYQANWFVVGDELDDDEDDDL